MARIADMPGSLDRVGAGIPSRPAWYVSRVKQIVVHEPGGPEAMALEERETPAPGPGQALVRVEAAGVNFIDVYHRTGLYPQPAPIPIGLEGAGVVEAVGPDAEIESGARVAWQGVPGSYASHVVAPASRLVPVPAELELRDAAAAMLQGMTAHYLAFSTHTLEEGQRCLVHAAAGGVGLLLCQLARGAGAHVIGTCSTEEKAAAAREAGARDVILYKDADFVAEVKRLTSGEGVHVVYDSVGKTTFDGSLACLAPRGLLVSFGQSSGRIAPLDPLVLAQKGSLFLTRPALADYVRTREDLLWRAGEVLDRIKGEKLRLTIDRALPLAEAAEAHRLLESRATSGKLLLLP
jgi:NADPH:quinone reductase